MATPRPDEMQFYAPRPQQNFDVSGQNVDLGGMQAQKAGDYFAYTNDRMSTNMAPVSALAKAGGAQALPTTFTGAPRPMDANMFAPRPSEVAPLSSKQQAFLDARQSPMGTGLSSAPLPTPMQQRELAKKAERAKVDESMDWAREMGRLPEEEQRKTDKQKQDAALALEDKRAANRLKLENAKIGSKEKIEGLRNASAEKRVEMQTATAERVQELKGEIASDEITASMNELVAQGKVPGYKQFDQVLQSQIDKLAAEGVITGQLQADEWKRRGLGMTMKIASDIMTAESWKTDPVAKDAAKKLLAETIAQLDAPAVQPTAPQAQATAGQLPKAGEAVDLDGNPNVTSQEESDYADVTRELASLDSTNPDQALRIRDLKEMQNVIWNNRKNKAKPVK